MHADFALCPGKVSFQQLHETAQSLGFIILVVSVANSARFRLVRRVG